MKLSAMWRGWPLEEALRRCSDPNDVEACDRHKQLWTVRREEQGSDEWEALFQAYVRSRSDLEQGFKEKLLDGELLASGFTLPLNAFSHRSPIGSGVWEILRLDFEQSSANCSAISFYQVEVYGGRSKPRRSAPSPMDAPSPDSGPGAPIFSFNPDFSCVRLREMRFVFGPKQANVIRLLYEASQTSESWCNGKRLLSQAGCEGMSFSGLFRRHEDPSWKELVDRDRRGFYRLKMEKRPG